jgi:hypothetical protein
MVIFACAAKSPGLRSRFTVRTEGVEPLEGVTLSHEASVDTLNESPGIDEVRSIVSGPVALLVRLKLEGIAWKDAGALRTARTRLLK